MIPIQPTRSINPQKLGDYLAENYERIESETGRITWKLKEEK